MLARAALTAHSYLAKPCPNDVLCSTIAHAIELQELLHSESIRACIGGIETLPAVPSVYRSLTEALQSDRSSPEHVARIVQEDVGISAKLLHLVNSSFFGLPRKTTSLLQTVRYLGLATIRSLVLAHFVFDQLGHGNTDLAERGQEHALRCARIARQLLQGKPDADLAFTAGLLHDVGTLVLASRMPEEYAAIAEHAAASSVPIHVVERERLGVDHAGVGSYLLALWGLPHDVLNVVAFHHTPGLTCQPFDAASAVRIAESIALADHDDPSVALCHAEALPAGWIETMNLGSAVARASTGSES